MKDSKFLDEPIQVRVKSGWDQHGKTGVCFGWIFKDQYWAIVVWDGGDDPETVKRDALEFLTQKWTSYE